MSTVRLDAETSQYIEKSCTPQDPVVASLVEATAALGDTYSMMTPVEEAAFLTTLAASISAKTVVEVGTLTGLSALAFARGLRPGGRVITLDVTEDWIDIARRHWEQAGVADRIDFRLGPARVMLPGIVADGEADIVFIDADKTSYPHYVEAAVPLLRTGGLLILDNVLLEGNVLMLDRGRAAEISCPLRRFSAEVMCNLNARLASDERFETVMLPIADGVTIARKL